MDYSRDEIINDLERIARACLDGGGFLTMENGRATDLSDEAALTEAVKERRRAGDYPLAAALNYILALREVAQKRTIYRHLPVIMHVEMSSFCNCACIMCTHCYERNDHARYLDFSLFERFLPTCRWAVINGIGEPFIHPDIVKILSRMKHYGVRLSLTTNAQYLPDDVLPLIGDVFQRICVSCDGAAAETFEEIRRGASFEKFLKNARVIRAHLRGDATFTMSVVSMRQNLLESVDLVRLAIRLGFDEIRFGRLSTNPFIGNEGDSINHYPNLAAQMLHEAKRTGEAAGIKVIIPVIFELDYDEAAVERERKTLLRSLQRKKDRSYYDNLRVKYQELQSSGLFRQAPYSMEGQFSCEGLCHWTAYGVNINSEGQVRPCGEIVREKNVADDPDVYLDNIMNNPESVRLREVFLSGRIPACCMNCSYLMGHENDMLSFDKERLKLLFV